MKFIYTFNQLNKQVRTLRNVTLLLVQITPNWRNTRNPLFSTASFSTFMRLWFCITTHAVLFSDLISSNRLLTTSYRFLWIRKFFLTSENNPGKKELLHFHYKTRAKVLTEKKLPRSGNLAIHFVRGKNENFYQWGYRVERFFLPSDCLIYSHQWRIGCFPRK